MTKRPETGPIQFGEDWPGYFIRGDNAGYLAMVLKEVLDRTESEDNILENIPLRGLVQGLQSSNVSSGEPVQELRPFDQCLMVGGLTPTRFEGPIVHPARVQSPSPLIVERRGEDSWAILRGGDVFNREGKWEYERSPSNRTDAFKLRSRWKWSEVGAAVEAAVVSLQGDWWLNEKEYDDKDDE